MANRSPRGIGWGACFATILAVFVVNGVARAQGDTPPPNDQCAAAQTIFVPVLGVPVTIAGNSLGATSDLAASTCSFEDSLDVWFRFTSPVAATYTIDTIGSGMLDTTIMILDGCGGSQLGCNDDIDIGAGNLWSQIECPMHAGDTILIRVAGGKGQFGPTTGPITLHVVGVGVPANDACSSATPISAGQTQSGTTAGAWTDFPLDFNACGTNGGSGGAADVFYSFVPPTTGAYQMSLCGSQFDTVLAVLTDCSGTPESIVACDDDSTDCTAVPGVSQISSVTLAAGTPYLVRVAGFDRATRIDSGAYTLLITFLPPGAGVCCRGATCNALVTAADCSTGGGTAGALYLPGELICNLPAVRNTPCCYADFNKINGVNLQDVFDFLADWFAGRSAAHVGGDGTTGGAGGVQSIFDFLSAWFAGC